MLLPFYPGAAYHSHSLTHHSTLWISSGHTTQYSLNNLPPMSAIHLGFSVEQYILTCRGSCAFLRPNQNLVLSSYLIIAVRINRQSACHYNTARIETIYHHHTPYNNTSLTLLAHALRPTSWPWNGDEDSSLYCSKSSLTPVITIWLSRR